MADLAHLLVVADAPTRTWIHPCGSKTGDLPIGEGQILVHVAKLVVTANTLTYAVAGKAPVLKYFQHFPIPDDAPKDLAMTPCWGTGIVIVSKCPKVKVGTRIHGYLPFSPSVVLTPVQVGPTSFTDGAPHRADLLPFYNMYFAHEDAQFKGMSYDEEDYQMATGQLFSTGWGMAQVAATHVAKPTALILTSASSRTSRAAAFASKFHKLPVQVIGLTSASNLDYVRGLDLYDVVCVYDDVGSLQNQRVAVHDVAGNATVKEALYRHFGKDIVYFGSVGISHVGSAGKQAKLEGLGGSQPAQFLVFTAIEEMEKVYGKTECQQMLGEAAKAYNAKMLPEFQAVRHFGARGTRAVFDDMVQGKAKPDCTYVCSMWPQDLHDPQVSTSKL